MKLFLHIGTLKTGTTTIQEFLRKNKELLKKQDILIPSSISYNGNHRWLTVLAYEKNIKDDFTREVFKNKSELRKKLINKKLKEFKQEISSSNENICIISSEHLSHRLKTKKDIRNLKKILDELFDEITVILYIRESMSGAISLHSTLIKQGKQFDGIDSNWYSNVINNLNIIKTWEKIFSKKNLKIKLFDKVEFVNDDLIQDFCSECNIKITSSFSISEKANKTLSLDQMKYLNYLNKFFPRFVDGRVNKKRGRLTDFIIKNFQSSNFFLPTKKEYQLFQEHFADDNDYIKREYFPHKKQLWSPYKQGFAEKENVINELSEREIEFLNAIKELWLRRKLFRPKKKSFISKLLRKFFNKIKALLYL